MYINGKVATFTTHVENFFFAFKKEVVIKIKARNVINNYK